MKYFLFFVVIMIMFYFAYDYDKNHTTKFVGKEVLVEKMGKILNVELSSNSMSVGYISYPKKNENNLINVVYQTNIGNLIDNEGDNDYWVTINGDSIIVKKIIK